jgi:hypothetical protein
MLSGESQGNVLGRVYVVCALDNVVLDAQHINVSKNPLVNEITYENITAIWRTKYRMNLYKKNKEINHKK